MSNGAAEDKPNLQWGQQVCMTSDLAIKTWQNEKLETLKELAVKH